jgi:glycosyltransferase involved in cell wall biosynthesis
MNQSVHLSEEFQSTRTLAQDNLFAKNQDAENLESINNRFKVAYITSRFPKITETFILFEMLSVEKLGVQIELYPFIRERTNVIHPEAQHFIDKAHYQPLISWSILKSNLYYLNHNPRKYLDIFWKIIRKNWGSFRFFTRALAIFPFAVNLSKLIEEEGVQHIHVHFSSHPAVAGYVIHRLTDIPYSFTAHGTDLHRDRHMLCEKISEAEFVITISEYNKTIILSECGEENEDKVMVIHCGVDTELFKPQIEYSAYSDNRDDNENMKIVCIGTLHEVKGQTYLLKACDALKEKGVNFTCHFVGDGPDWGTLTQQVIKTGLNDQVIFHGRLTRGEIVKLLREADVLVAPSVRTKDGRREGIPVVLMEGMSSGLAVIASDISGIPELIENGKTGLLVPPRDEQSLADALECLYLNKDLRHKLGIAGRLKVIEDFQLDRNASKLVGLFENSVRA